jgi:hypothetical protein
MSHHLFNTGAHTLLFAGLLVSAMLGLHRPAQALHPVASASAPLALPLVFEPNVGQVGSAAGVRYLARGSGYDAAFASTEATVAFGDTASPVRMRLVGADPRAVMTAEQPLGGKVHYLRGSDRKLWRRNVPTFGRIRARQVYPGIDLVYYGTPDKLEHDFVVAPGADPRRIAVEYAGAERVRLADHGRLILTIRGRDIFQHPPVAYQQFGGKRIRVPACYRLAVTPTLPLSHSPARVSFDLAAYDPTQPLIIDPVLDWSTRIPSANGRLLFDASGAMYFVGTAPQAGGGNQPPTDVAVTKLVTDGTAAGTTILFRVEFGGSLSETLVDAEFTPSGEIAILGSTKSTDLPVMGGVQSALLGQINAFVTKLSADGSQVSYSTYFGRSLLFPARMAIDSTGAITFAGSISADDLPTANATQATRSGGRDGFITKLSPDGAQVVYSTYLGGNEDDLVSGLGVDRADNLYVIGVTSSANFPTLIALQRRIGSFVRDGPDGFVTKRSPTGAPLYSTFLGGEAGDWPGSILVDPRGFATIVGSTDSTRFPTYKALQPQIGPYNPHHATGPTDAFISRLKPDGSAFVFSTYLGGGGYDFAGPLARDSTGNLYVGGQMEGIPPRSKDPHFPLKDSLQPFPAYSTTISVGFITKLRPDGSAILYSTLLGGNGTNFVSQIALDASDQVYVTGISDSHEYPFPMTDVVAPPGLRFVAKLGESSGRLALEWKPLNFRTISVGQTRSLRLTLKNTGRDPLRVTPLLAPTMLPVTFKPAGRLTLAEGETIDLKVTLAPTTAGPIRGQVLLLTTDQRRAYVPVPLWGAGKAP